MRDMASSGSRPKALFIVNSIPQAEIFDSVRKELHGFTCVAVTIDWYFRHTRKALDRAGFPFKPIESYGIGRLENLFEQEEPDIVIVGSDVQFVVRLIIRRSNERKIPTLLVQDGLLTHRGSHSYGINPKWLVTHPTRFLKFLLNRRWSLREKGQIALFQLLYGSKGRLGSFGHGGCARMALLGEATRELLVAGGIANDRMVVTGSPKFDRIVHFSEQGSTENIRERWNIPGDRDIVLLTTQDFVGSKLWDEQRNRKFVRAIARAAAALRNVHLIIKLHPPGESRRMYHEHVADITPRPTVCKDTSLHELIRASSLVLTVSSTAALEAMAIGKPVMIVDLFNDPGASLFRRSGAIYVVREEEILPAMEKGLRDKGLRELMAHAMQRFVYRQAYLQDGQAAARIAKVIESTLLGTNRFPPQSNGEVMGLLEEIAQKQSPPDRGQYRRE